MSAVPGGNDHMCVEILRLVTSLVHVVAWLYYHTDQLVILQDVHV